MSFESRPERVSTRKPAKLVGIGEKIRCFDETVRSVAQMIGETDNHVRLIFTDGSELLISNDAGVDTVKRD